MRLLDALPAGADAADLAVRVTATLAHSEAELGRVEVAERMLRTAMTDGPRVGPEATGILFNQRGLLLLRQGRAAEAVEALTRAVDELAACPQSRCAVLLNRSAAHLYRGRVRPAADDLQQCAALAAAHRHPVLEAKARHNLGYLALLRRDFPAALRDLAAAHDALREIAPGYCGVVLLDRARVLRDAGLLGDADAELATAIEVFTDHRLGQDLAEAHLVRAEVALMAGRLTEARRQAVAARRRFRPRHNATRALLADLVLAQTDPSTGRGAERALAVARDVAARLSAAGLDDDARFAGLVADRIELRVGGRPGRPTARGGDRLAVRLQVRLVRSELARAGGDERAARREIRRGLDELHRHRSGLGSHDLQTGTGVHGQQLIDSALRAALRDGRPAVVHGWIERTRAVALRMAPVRPPSDPVLAGALAEVRALRAAERDAELAGRPTDPTVATHRAELERVVRHRAWQVDGTAGRDDVVGLGGVRAQLAPAGGALVTFVVVDGSLSALVATARATRLEPLGAMAGVEAAVTRLRADFDVAATGGLVDAVRRVVAASTTAGLAALDAALWRPVARWTGSGPVVVVPTGVLGAVPWPCLPGLRGRPVAVAPSATRWCAGERGTPIRGGRAFAAGPGLARADAEVRAAAAAWPGATVATGDRATTGHVLDRAGCADLLHLAAHGRHQPQNPLFSCVELADGPLFGYDLPGAEAMAAHVVLSACDAGLAVVRAGDEPLGMTAAFLHAGAVSVVSSVARVGDDIAGEAMADYHRRLGAGGSVAEALAATVAAVGSPDRPVPFVAHGAAW